MLKNMCVMNIEIQVNDLNVEILLVIQRRGAAFVSDDDREEEHANRK